MKVICVLSGRSLSSLVTTVAVMYSAPSSSYRRFDVSISRISSRVGTSTPSGLSTSVLPRRWVRAGRARSTRREWRRRRKVRNARGLGVAGRTRSACRLERARPPRVFSLAARSLISTISCVSRSGLVHAGRVFAVHDHHRNMAIEFIRWSSARSMFRHHRHRIVGGVEVCSVAPSASRNTNCMRSRIDFVTRRERQAFLMDGVEHLACS